MRLLPSPSEIWRRDHPWASLYSFALAHPPLAIAGGRVLMGTDMRLLFEAVDELGELPQGAAVLDVPCGNGVALRGLEPSQGLRYVACDISEAMLERTAAEAERRGLRWVEPRAGDIEALPFADGEFDACVSFTGLHCVPHPRAAVGELARVLRPGGRLLGSLLLADAPLHRRHVLLIGRGAGLLGPSASEEQITDWLAAAGFREIELRRSGDLAYFRALRGS